MEPEFFAGMERVSEDGPSERARRRALVISIAAHTSVFLLLIAGPVSFWASEGTSGPTDMPLIRFYDPGEGKGGGGGGGGSGGERPTAYIPARVVTPGARAVRNGAAPGSGSPEKTASPQLRRSRRSRLACGIGPRVRRRFLPGRQRLSRSLAHRRPRLRGNRPRSELRHRGRDWRRRGNGCRHRRRLGCGSRAGRGSRRGRLLAGGMGHRPRTRLRAPRARPIRRRRARRWCAARSSSRCS